MVSCTFSLKPIHWLKRNCLFSVGRWFPLEGVSVGFRVGLPENGVSQNGNFRAMLDNIYVCAYIYIYIYLDTCWIIYIYIYPITSHDIPHVFYSHSWFKQIPICWSSYDCAPSWPMDPAILGSDGILHSSSYIPSHKLAKSWNLLLKTPSPIS